ncbi:MAG: sulfotransferase family protein [Acidimicrobiia bacterium]
MERTDVVIAGVNKAGTTSLYVSLAEHPDVAPSAVKETRYFLPARYGRPLAPIEQWERSFAGRTQPVRLEATPSYFYGGAAVARAMQQVLVRPRVLLVLREPVARAVSFFEYQKVRLRFPAELTMEEYLAQADALGDTVGADPETEPYMAERGGRYADWLPEWWDVFGPEALMVLYFEDLLQDPRTALAAVARWVGLDPAGLPSDLRAENRTTAFKNARLQALALRVNDGAERLLRRAPAVKRGLRAVYFKLNGRRPAAPTASPELRAELARRFAEPNARLAAQLDAAGLRRPPWLE